MKRLLLGMVLYIVFYYLNNKKNNDKIIQKKHGAYFIHRQIIVNQDFKISPLYIPLPKLKAKKALLNMIHDAKKQDFQLIIISGFRSYIKQKRLFNLYVKRDGIEKAMTYSAKPGFSEHQTGLAFDVAVPGLDESIKEQFQYTKESKWMKNNAHRYGFIIRYPKDKEHITKFMYEPWHLRYVGKKDAKKIVENDLTLEEYFHLI